MSLPQSVNYGEQLSSLPAGTECLTQIASPINGSTFQPGSLIQFDLVNRSFLVPDSVYIRYSYTLTGAVGCELIGTPVFSPFVRSEVLFGSQIVETIQGYNQCLNFLSNTTMSISEKFGMMSAFGYFDSTSTPINSQFDGRIMLANETGAFCGPLVNILTNSDKLIPLFLANTRIQLTLDNLQNIFTPSVVPTNYVLSNVELCYKILSIPSAETYTMSLDKFYIKSSSWVSSSVTLPAGTSGSNSLIYNQRLASIKGIVQIFSGQDGVTSKNGWGDAFHPSATSTYQWQIAGQMYPSRPINIAMHKSAVLMELKQCMGSIYDRVNAMSINAVEGAKICGDSTTVVEPGKAYLAVSTERYNGSGALLTGISSQNSPISFLLNTTATSKSLLATCLINFDSLIEFDTRSRQVTVQQ